MLVFPVKKLKLKIVMTNDKIGNRLGTADRHLISVIGDQVKNII